jgi:hypothetical protein
MHLCLKIVIIFLQSMSLYMFRTLLCPSSGAFHHCTCSLWLSCDFVLVASSSTVLLIREDDRKQVVNVYVYFLFYLFIYYFFFFLHFKILKVKRIFTGMKYLNMIPIRRICGTKISDMTLNKSANIFVTKSSYVT